MAILLKTILRKNPFDRDAAPKYYPVQKTIKMIDETENLPDNGLQLYAFGRIQCAPTSGMPSF